MLGLDAGALVGDGQAPGFVPERVGAPGIAGRRVETLADFGHGQPHLMMKPVDRVSDISMIV